MEFQYRWRLKPVAVDDGSLSVAASFTGFRPVIVVVCNLLCVCLSAAPAIAIDGTWTGVTSGDWNTDTNWSPGPTPTNTASFTNNGAPTSVAIGGLSSINTIQFAAGAPTYSFTFPVSVSQAFTINGTGIINNSSNAPIFGLGQIFFKNGSTAGNAVFSLVEFDDHSNAGTATISSAPGSGSTAEFTGSSSAANATITTGNGSQTSFGDSSTGGNANIITNSGGRTLFSGSSTAGNASILTRNGGRTDFFTLATGQARFVTEAGGIVDFSNAFGAGFSHQITAGSIAGAGGYFLGRNALTVGSNGLSTTVDGVIADGGISGGVGASLIKIGAGTLVLSGVNSYSGGTTVSGGTLQLAGAGTLGATTAALSILGGILDLNGTSQTTGAMTLNGGSIVGGTLTSSSFGIQSGTVSAALAGAGALTMTGGGTATLSGANSYTGGTSINAGTLQLAGTGTLGATTGSLMVFGGTLDLNGTSQTTGAMTLNGGSIVGGTLASSSFGVQSGTISAVLAGAGALTKSTAGTVTLSAVSTYTGGTSINAGTLEASHVTAGAIDVFGTNSITISGGSLRSTVSGQIANNISFANGTTSTFSAAAANTVTTTGFLTFSDNSVARFGSATETGTIVIGLPGGIFISSSSQLEVNGGTLRSAAGANFLSSLTGANASTTVAAGATLDFNDQISPPSGGISNLLGSGLVVTGTNATTDLRIASGTFAGEITGAGSVHVANFFFAAPNGRLLLTGANSYTGGTFVDANHVLQIGNGGATGSVIGNVVDNGVFAINRSNAYTFAGAISGNGAFQQDGSGNTTLSGVNTYTGPTSVNAGTLSVNGSIAASSLTTVNAGATLGGNGVVGNTIINGGTLAPGNSIGLLSVQGNLVFTAASSYMVEVSPSNADRTNVTGMATLGGATVSANFAAGSYVAKQYSIVNAGGGVIGTFGPLVKTNLPSGFHSSLSYDANDAYLDLVLDYSTVTGLNGNQQNVGNALTKFFNSSGGIPIVFGSLTPAGLTQASGETATGSQQTTFNAMTQFLSTLLDPFIGGRGDSSAPAGAVPFAEEDDATRAYAPQGRKGSGVERDAYRMMTKAAPRNPVFDPRWSVWTAGFGGSQTTDGNAVAGSNSTTSRIFGAAIGADYLFSPRTIAGFAFAGGGTNFGVANGGSGRSDLFQAGAFIRQTVGNAYVSGALAYGWQDVTTDRTITIAGVDRLRAEFNANAFSGRVEGGYRLALPWLGGVGLTPYAAGQFSIFDLPAYAEQVVSGANNFAVAYAAKSVTASRSELGFRADKSLALQNAILTLRGRAAWAHDFNADRNIAATFQTLPGASFVVNGAAQARDAALTSAAAEMKWLNGVSLAAIFEGEFSAVTRSYAGKGVARYAW